MKRIALVLAVVVAIPAAAGAAPERATSPRATKNIVQTAVAAGQFTTLVSLVKQAGLASALTGKGNLTVFAPTDAAFKKVPAATLAKLQRDRALLRKVLLYHVVKGKVTAAQVVKLRSAKTLAGPALNIRVKNGSVLVNTSKVTKTDIAASNGVIHVVNAVLIPPAS